MSNRNTGTTELFSNLTVNTCIPCTRTGLFTFGFAIKLQMESLDNNTSPVHPDDAVLPVGEPTLFKDTLNSRIEQDVDDDDDGDDDDSAAVAEEIDTERRTKALAGALTGR
jgi:hypothetical protein